MDSLGSEIGQKMRVSGFRFSFFGRRGFVDGGRFVTDFFWVFLERREGETHRAGDRNGDGLY